MKKFKTPMNFFKIIAGKWRMLVLFEPKDGVETFINPRFSEGDFQFISEILKKQWPKKEVIEVVKEVEVEVVKEVPVASGKPSVLNRAI
jgi:hypothetical protein